MLEIIITAMLSVMIYSRLLRALREFADACRPHCPSLADALDKALFRPVDSFLEAQGYCRSQKYAEAIQRASNALQERQAETARGDALVGSLAQAALRLRVAEGELAEARKIGGGDPLYASVGLHPNAEPFLVEAAQRAFRKKYHPDGYPPHAKRAAEEQFKRNEDTFERIRASRRRAS
jgi:hypothetical protein